MKLIVGLGNPGSQYAKTRHNLGFMVLDQLVTYHGWPQFSPQNRFEALVTEAVYSAGGKQERLILAKPVTMMNDSGRAVAKIAGFFKVEPEDIWVVHDDVDLEYGQLRIRRGGSAGGHNGVNSIIQAMGAEFVRFRVGIGSNRAVGQTSEIYVMKPFSLGQRRQLPQIITGTAKSIMHHALDAEIFDHNRNLLA